jgi:hypothetical protein
MASSDNTLEPRRDGVLLPITMPDCHYGEHSRVFIWPLDHNDANGLVVWLGGDLNGMGIVIGQHDDCPERENTLRECSSIINQYYYTNPCYYIVLVFNAENWINEDASNKKYYEVDISIAPFTNYKAEFVVRGLEAGGNNIKIVYDEATGFIRINDTPSSLIFEGRVDTDSDSLLFNLIKISNFIWIMMEIRNRNGQGQLRFSSFDTEDEEGEEHTLVRILGHDAYQTKLEQMTSSTSVEEATTDSDDDEEPEWPITPFVSGRATCTEDRAAPSRALLDSESEIEDHNPNYDDLIERMMQENTNRLEELAKVSDPSEGDSTAKKQFESSDDGLL